MSSRSHADVSRAAAKLAAALDAFCIHPDRWVCADLGSNAGGFVDCLLQRGADKVYAVERGYGVLDYSLRRDPRVVVMERCDARHVVLPEKVPLVTIDVGWTRQSQILPAAKRLLWDRQPFGQIISLIKPHYEAAPSLLTGGVLPDELVESVLSPIRAILPSWGLALRGETVSPIRGHGGNAERLWLLAPAE